MERIVTEIKNIINIQENIVPRILFPLKSFKIKL
jgi:hypothetical protein